MEVIAKTTRRQTTACIRLGNGGIRLLRRSIVLTKFYSIIFSQKELPKNFKLAGILLVECKIKTSQILKSNFVTMISSQIQEYYRIFITI